MDPMTILALSQGVLGLGQSIGGMLSKGKRPEYELPPALRESLALAKINVADPNAAGYGQAKEQADLTLANQLAAAQQQGNPQESIQSLAASQQKTMRDLEMYNQQSQQQDYASLQGELGKLQQAQDLQFQMNEFAPYADQSQQSKNIIGAGLQNLYGAGDMYAQIDMINKLYPSIKKSKQSFTKDYSYLSTGLPNFSMAKPTSIIKKPQ